MEPITREENFLQNILNAASGETTEELTPITREEKYLDEIREAIENGGGGGGGGVTPAQLQEEVNARIEGDLELDDEKADVIENSASGSLVTFTDGSGKNADELIVNIEPVQSGSGDPSPSNVRPISGWTGCEINVVGKNWFDKDAKNTANGYVSGKYLSNDGTLATPANPGTWNVSEYINVCPNMTYTIKGTTGNNPALCEYDGNKGFVNGVSYQNSTEKTFTTSSTTKYIRLSVPVSNENILQLEYGSVATDYEPYNANSTTTTITWQTEAGTVYGGTLNVTTGELTADRAIITIDGVTNKCTVCSGGATVATPSINISGLGSGKPLASSLKPLSTLAGVRSASNSIYNAIPDSLSRLLLNCDGMIGYGGTSTYATETELLSAVNTWLSTNNVTVVYPLATPVTYQLTPTEVATLVGTNNIFADAGDVTVTYKADTKGYVDSKVDNNISEVNTKISELKQTEADIIAPTEDGTTASQAYAKGEYFLRNDQLYKAKTAIASGASFTPGTNCELTNVAAGLASAGGSLYWHLVSGSTSSAYLARFNCIIIDNNSANITVNDLFSFLSSGGKILLINGVGAANNISITPFIIESATLEQNFTLKYIDSNGYVQSQALAKNLLSIDNNNSATHQIM